jgi:hypothetical protein
MSEPSSGVPSEIADAEVETPERESEEPSEVTLDLDDDKLEAWDEVKSDYQVDPDGVPTPNSMASEMPSDSDDAEPSDGSHGAADESTGSRDGSDPDASEEADGTAPG